MNEQDLYPFTQKYFVTGIQVGSVRRNTKMPKYGI